MSEHCFCCGTSHNIKPVIMKYGEDQVYICGHCCNKARRLIDGVTAMQAMHLVRDENAADCEILRATRPTQQAPIYSIPGIGITDLFDNLQDGEVPAHYQEYAKMHKGVEA
jgi:hypothetical protein